MKSRRRFINQAAVYSLGLVAIPKLGISGNNNLSVPKTYSNFELGPADENLIIVDYDSYTHICALNYSINGPFSKTLQLFCETLTIDGTVTLEGRGFEVYAKQIICKNNARIVTSGKSYENEFFSKALSGQAPGENGQHGSDKLAKDGQPSGNIFISCFELVGELILMANGGNGSKGQEGGDGIAGRNGPNGSNDKHEWACDGGSEGQNGQAGGVGGTGGRGGNGGRGGMISLTIIDPNNQKYTYENKKGLGGTPGIGGKGSRGGIKGTGGVRYEAHNEPDEGGRRYKYCSPDGRFGDGIDGRDGPDGKDGTAGKDGLKGSFSFENEFKKYARSLPSVLAEMIINNAELNYIGGRYTESISSLSWINMVMESGQIEGDQDFLSNKSRAEGNLRKLSLGMDFWGNPINYVTLVSKDFINTYLAEAFKLGESIEESYEKFFARDASNKVKKRELVSAKEKQAFVLEESINKIIENAKKANTVSEEIKKLVEDIERQYQQLLLTEQSFRDAVARKSKCDFQKTLDCINLIVSVGRALYGDYTAIVSAAQSANNVFKSSMKEDEIDNIVAKAEVISSSVNTVAQKIDDIKVQFNAIKDAFEEDKTLMQIQKGDFEALLKEYGDMPEARTLKLEFDNYVQTINLKNEKRLEYTALILLNKITEAEIGGIKTQIEKYNWDANVIENQLSSRETIRIMRNMYATTRLYLYRLLYLERKAFEYWNLEIAPGLNINDFKIASLKAYHLNIKSKIISKMDSRGHGSGTAENLQEIVFLEKEYPLLFKNFKNGNLGKHEMILTIPLDHPSFSPLWSEIYATSVDVLLKGVSADNNRTILRVVHLGNSTIVNQAGQKFEFSHVPIYLSFTRNMTSGITSEDIENNLVGNQQEDNKHYVGVSPFATWRLQIDANNHQHLNLANVSEVSFRFKFNYRTLIG